MGGVILDGLGHPLAPASIIADLQAINPRLGIQYHAGLHAFVVTLKWPEGDPRYQAIQEGRIAPNSDYEILCPVPAHVSLDEVNGWVKTQLRRVSQNREDVRRMIDEQEAQTQRHNEAVAEAKLAEAREELAMSADKKTIDVGKRRTRVK